MDFEELEIVLAIVRFGSFRKAAQFLHLSQPSVTYQVQKLEDRLGSRLFVRNQNGIQLTRSGKQLVLYSKKILDLWNQAKHTIQQHRELTVGFCPSIAFPSVLESLGDLHNAVTKVRIEIIIDDTRKLMTSLQHGQMDLAVVKSPASWDNRLFKRELFINKIVLVHRHESMPCENLSALPAASGARFVTPASESDITTIKSKLKQQRVEVGDFKRLTELPSIKSYVAKDWFAILSDPIASNLVAQKRVQEIEMPGLFPFYKPVYAVWSAACSNRSEVTILAEWLEKAFTEFSWRQTTDDEVLRRVREYKVTSFPVVKGQSGD